MLAITAAPPSGLEAERWLGEIQHGHLGDAFHLLRRRVIAGFQRGAHHRWPLDRRIDHSRHARVDAENRFAGNDRLQVHDGNVFADIAKLIGRLEPDGALFRSRGAGYQWHQFAISDLAPGFGVHHEAVLSVAFLLRYAPLGGGRVFEHGARRSAGRAQHVVEIAHGARAIGILRTVFRVAQRLNHLDARPIGFQFIGHDHGQACAAARPHFGAVGHDLDRAVRFDAQVHAGLPGFLPAQLGNQRRGDHQRSGGEKLAEETPARGMHHAGHASTPAAILIAWRMR